MKMEYKLSDETASINSLYMRCYKYKEDMATVNSNKTKQYKTKIHVSCLCAAGVLKYFNRIIGLDVCSQIRALAKKKRRKKYTRVHKNTHNTRIRTHTNKAKKWL